jgi:hypothetical protein
MTRTAIGTIVCRAVVPLWLLAGASFKLAQLDPKLLPPVVLSTITSTDGMLGLSGNAWMDLALRLIIMSEFVIAALMICVPRLSRIVAIALLTFFCGILLTAIVPSWQKGGFEEVLRGGCGCFGAAGPNPLYMLLIDGSMLAAAMIFPVSVRGALPPITKGAWPAMGLCIIGSAIAFGMPAPQVTLEEPDAVAQAGTDSGASAGAGSASAKSPDGTAMPATGPGDAPAGDGTKSVSASEWPGRPEKVESYYLGEFEKWVGQRLDAQPIMRLLAAPPPATIQKGRWHVVFFRSDCDHCHALMSAYFEGELEVPVLAVEVPDTDPSNALPNPCERCDMARLLKGPSWVFTTPVLLTVEDGVVTCVATDSENTEQVEACISR